MSDRSDSLISLLNPYGLDVDEALVYLELWENGEASALKLSRNLRIARTKVYRILDILKTRGLVMIRLGGRGMKFQASSPKKLSMLVNEKKLEVERLSKNLELVEDQLMKVGKNDKEESRVLYYKGVEGVKQVTYNSLQAKGELLTMEIEDMDGFFKHDYAEEMRLKFIERKIAIRTLTNLKKINPWTEKGSEMVEKYWEIRHIPKDQLKIQFEILIYNDVYVMYRYQDKEVFCVEIYNQELADMQRQVFEYMFRKAGKFRVLNREGEAELIK